MQILDNIADYCPGVFVMNNCTLLNRDSLYSGNKAMVYFSGAMHGAIRSIITNINTTVRGNWGTYGLVRIEQDSKLFNNHSTFRYIRERLLFPTDLKI